MSNSCKLPSIFFFLTLLLRLTAARADLVEIKKVQPKIIVDFRYACSNNPFGRSLYPFSSIYVDRFTAHRLGRVRSDLAKEGLGLIIYEGYRPPSVQKAIESFGSPNCRDEAPHYRKGLGVDVAIYYLNGQPLELPTAYGVCTPRTYRDYGLLPPHVYHNSAILEEIMVRYGFVSMREKWWHFDLRGWEEAPNSNLEYRDLIEKPPCSWE